ncbi:AAA family ATPase [Nocardiopsis synnemataformans]|uniref:AAA family ATPase n=1 Tax=Nocardiopsis synnemataformans TaxID=61305 RepID=UPI003EBCE1AE
MGLHNFTSQEQDDQSGSGGPGAPASPHTAHPAGISGVPSSDHDDVKQLLVNYNERFSNTSPTPFRDALVAQVISVLVSRTKPNPLLVGAAGVGKTRIVEDIARRLADDDLYVPQQLKGYTIYELPLSSLIAGAGFVGVLEARLSALVEFLSSPEEKAILFVDEIHQITKSSGGHSADSTYEKIAQILKPALARGDIRVIGATTLQESRGFDNDPALKRRFTRLIVDELTREQTVEVLKVTRPDYVQHYQSKVTVSDDVLSVVARVADEISSASAHRPDNALTLLDRTMADTVVSHQAAIASAQAVGDTATAQVLQRLTQLPITEPRLRSVALRLSTGVALRPTFDEAALRNGLSQLRGQEEVLNALVDVLRREELGAFPRTRPNAWMFAGPSGVGKTEATKIIAEQVTGQPPIMLNMGEYHHPYDTAKIIGAPPGYIGSDSDKELPFDSLEANPYRVVLLDEFEKADRAVHQLFLAALDEGWMQMASGKVIDFSKVIIIATTNAAREFLCRNPMGFQASFEQQTLSRQELTRGLQEAFPPELLGRFSELVAFNAITRDAYKEVLVASYEREHARLIDEKPKLGQKVPPTIDPDVLCRTVNSTYSPNQGARPARAAARRLIEDYLLAFSPAATPGTTATPAPVSPERDVEHKGSST